MATKTTDSIDTAFDYIESVFRSSNDEKTRMVAKKNLGNKDRIIKLYGLAQGRFVELGSLAAEKSWKTVMNVGERTLGSLGWFKGKPAILIRGVTYYGLPLYVSLKATAIVTKEVMMEVLESRLSRMKVTYEASKDLFTLLVSGKFQDEALKEKISEGMSQFKNLTIEIVQKGLRITVDRKSLMENYDLFGTKLQETISKVRQLSTENLVNMKTNSVNLYRSVILKIQEKETKLKLEYETHSSL